MSGVLELTAIHTNICSRPFTPLVNSRIDNVLVRIAPELNQPLFQFVNAMESVGKHAPAWSPTSGRQLG